LTINLRARSRAQLDGTVGFRRGPIHEIGLILIVILKELKRCAGFLEEVVLPREQLLAKIILLALIHEGLILGRLFRVHQFWLLDSRSDGNPRCNLTGVTAVSSPPHLG
jgi:hypothetical protein